MSESAPVQTDPTARARCLVFTMAHGESRYHRHAAYLLRSLQAWASATELDAASVELGVVTDRPEHWQAHGVRVIHLTREQINAWIGASGFKHVVKVHVFERIFDLGYQRAVFMDADMFATGPWLAPLQQISPTAVVMEQAEGRLDERGDILAKKLYARFGKQPVVWQGEQPELLPRDIPIYNSGVLGLHAAHRELLLPNARFTQRIYAAFKKHNLGQLAWSYTLHRAGVRIHTLHPALYHYWQNPQQGLRILDDFFAGIKGQSEAEQSAAIRAFRFGVAKPRQHFLKRLERGLRSSALDLNYFLRKR